MCARVGRLEDERAVVRLLGALELAHLAVHVAQVGERLRKRRPQAQCLLQIGERPLARALLDSAHGAVVQQLGAARLQLERRREIGLGTPVRGCTGARGGARAARAFR